MKSEQSLKIFSKLDLSYIYLFLSKGDLPVKYVYKTTQGTNLWSSMENASGNWYDPFSVYESKLLLKNSITYLEEIKNNGKEIVIFDFGPGEGRSVEKFLEKLSKKQKVFYHAFDISQFILEKNKKRITNISKNINYNSTIIDFESWDFFEEVVKVRLKYDNKNVLGLFLGSTVGNFTSIKGILQKMLQPFGKDDRIVLGIAKSEINNKIWLKELINTYEDKKVIDFGFSAIQELGVKKENVLLEIEFNYKESAIEWVSTFKNDTIINIGNKELEFKKGHKIRIGKSEKVNEIKMIKIFEDLNLRVCNFSTSDDDKYIQTCLSNKNYF